MMSEFYYLEVGMGTDVTKLEIIPLHFEPEDVMKGMHFVISVEYTPAGKVLELEHSVYRKQLARSFKTDADWHIPVYDYWFPAASIHSIEIGPDTGNEMRQVIIMPKMEEGEIITHTLKVGVEGIAFGGPPFEDVAVEPLERILTPHECLRVISRKYKSA